MLGILAGAVLLLVVGSAVQVHREHSADSVQNQTNKRSQTNTQKQSDVQTESDGQEETSDTSVSDDEPYTEELFAMDTYMSITAYGEEAQEAVNVAVQVIRELDAILSAENEDSEVFMLNTVGEGEVSDDTATLLIRAKEVYEKTDGLFDFTIYPVMELWGFPTMEYEIPSEDVLLQVLSLVDASQVSVEGEYVTLGEGQAIDLGAIAKGYTSDRVMEVFEACGVESGMVSLGGNVQVKNVKPDGSLWRIGIRDPKGGYGDPLAVVQVANQAVITSGGYERYFEEDGKTYIHILDPRTGYPADQDLDSVTIISPDGTLADALSTSLFIMGYEEAVSYWRVSEDIFDVVFVKKDGTIAVTEGIADQFQSTKKAEIIVR